MSPPPFALSAVTRQLKTLANHYIDLILIHLWKLFPPLFQNSPDSQPDMGCCFSGSDGEGEGDTKHRGDSGCKTCCLKTRNCVMSGECGRALQIANVCAMCGMCIRMFVCKYFRDDNLRGNKDVKTPAVSQCPY